MSKQSAQAFIIASLILIIAVKTDMATRVIQINNLAFKGSKA